EWCNKTFLNRRRSVHRDHPSVLVPRCAVTHPDRAVPQAVSGPLTAHSDGPVSTREPLKAARVSTNFTPASANLAFILRVFYIACPLAKQQHVGPPIPCYKNLLPGDPAPWVHAREASRPDYAFDTTAYRQTALIKILRTNIRASGEK